MLDFRKEMEKMFINESPVAVLGDWTKKDDLGSKSILVLGIQWTKKDKIGRYELWKHRSSNSWILGEYIETNEPDKPRFNIVFSIDFSNKKNIGYKLNYKKLYNVDEVGVDKKYRGDGIATNMYKYFIKVQGYSIISDTHQYFGARKVWSRLSKELDILVDIIDTKNNILVKEDVILHHGNQDEEFDREIWSYDGDKQHIRLILKDIL